jgi:hypothetical protein
MYPMYPTSFACKAGDETGNLTLETRVSAARDSFFYGQTCLSSLFLIKADTSSPRSGARKVPADPKEQSYDTGEEDALPLIVSIAGGRNMRRAELAGNQRKFPGPGQLDGRTGRGRDPARMPERIS